MKNILKNSFFIAASSMLIIFSGCGAEDNASQVELGNAKGASLPPEVSCPAGVLTIKEESRVIIEELPGRVAAPKYAEVCARVAGVILKKHFVEGSVVKAGDLLFEIDPEPYKAVLMSAQANLKRAQAGLEQAELTFKRYSELVKIGGVSRQNYDNSRIAVEVAKAEILAAQAAVKTAGLNLGYATVTAPITGRIGEALKTEGALVGQGSVTKLALIQQMDPIYVDFSQSTRSLIQMKRDIASGKLIQENASELKVDARFDDGTKYNKSGKLLFSDIASVDMSTGMYKLRAEFPNPNNDLLPGMFVRALLYTGIDTKSILVPQKAVTRGLAGRATIFVLDKDNYVIPRPITANDAYGNNWIVTAGLKKGDRVVVDGLISIGMNMGRGMRVKVIPQDPETFSKVVPPMIQSAAAQKK